MGEVGQTLSVIPQCYVYKIPPMKTAAGHRAADWDTSNPMWQGKCRVTGKGNQCIVLLEEEQSGDLFAQCPVVDGAVEPVSDSSRFFAVRVEQGGRHAFIGLGFADRTHAFDFNVAISDFRKHLRQEQEANEARERLAAEPEVDLTLKSTITVSLKTGAKKKKPRTTKGGGAFKLAPPPKASTNVVKSSTSSSKSSGSAGLTDAFSSFDPFAQTSQSSTPVTTSGSAGVHDPFAALGATTNTSNNSNTNDPFAGWGSFSGSGGGSGDDWAKF